MQDYLVLKLHLLPVQVIPVQQAKPSAQESVRLPLGRVPPDPCDLFPVLVGGQFKCPLQKALPVGSLDDRCCHFFLFPAQGAADWLVGHLRAQSLSH